MTDVPNMEVLLKDAPTNWGKWGPDDEVGALNYLTADEVLRGVRHISSGSVFTLQRLIGDPNGDPVWPGRSPAEKTMILDESSWDGDGAPQFPGGLHYADDKIVAFLQGSTQYDALGHVWYGGQIWNGYDARTTVGGLGKASVAPIAERGVAGRGILLDMARFRGKDNLDKAETFTHEDLLACAEAQGVTIEKRDILVIRTNFLKLFFEQGDAFYEGFCEPGLDLQPRAGGVVPGHGDPEPGHRHHRQRGHHRPEHRRRAAAALRADAQPRRHPDRDLRPGEARGLVRGGPPVHLPLRRGAAQGERGQRLAGQPAGDQVAGGEPVTTYTDRPWLPLYREGTPADITAEFATMLDLFAATVARAPAAVAIRYFDAALTFADLDTRSDALAVALVEHGFAPGDRLAVYTAEHTRPSSSGCSAPGRPAARRWRSTR